MLDNIQKNEAAEMLIDEQDEVALINALLDHGIFNV